MAIGVTKKLHAKYAPSAAHRWLSCPGSVALCETVPKPPQSQYASEGETAHAVLEKCLKDPRINPFDLVDVEIETGGGTIKVTEEMVEAVTYALDIIRAEHQKGGDLLVEKELTIIPEESFGTVDAAIVQPLRSLTIFDFKYGQGVIVSAVDNPQLLLYALPLALEFDVPNVKLVIIQPRTEQQVSSWECSEEYLSTFTQEVIRKIALTREKDAMTIAGDWCKFCPAKHVCPALRKEIADAFPPVPEREALFPDVKGLPTETLKKILDYKDRITDWLDSVAAYAQDFLKDGGEIPGYALGKKRANRKWKDEKEAIASLGDLGDKIYDVKLKSPAQMEKIAGKERVSGLTEIPDNGMTLKRTEKKETTKKALPGPGIVDL